MTKKRMAFYSYQKPEKGCIGCGIKQAGVLVDQNGDKFCQGADCVHTPY